MKLLLLIDGVSNKKIMHGWSRGINGLNFQNGWYHIVLELVERRGDVVNIWNQLRVFLDSTLLQIFKLRDYDVADVKNG